MHRVSEGTTLTYLVYFNLTEGQSIMAHMESWYQFVGIF